MTQAKSFFVRLMMCSLLLSLMAMNKSEIGNVSEAGAPSSHAVVSMPKSQTSPYCTYLPEWELFKKGQEVVQHPLGHSGRPDEPGTSDGYDILLPNVKRQTTEYSQITFKQGDK